jgi:hypothetical protein
MALINQKDSVIPETIYVKHPTSGVEVIEVAKLAEYLAVGYVKLVSPTWRYHAIHVAQIFDASEVADLEKDGWVDSPAKLVPEVVPTAADATMDLDEEAVKRVDQVAQTLLASDGLSRAALMRELDMNPNNSTQRNRFAPVYKELFARHLPNIKKEGLNKWYWKTKTILADGTPPEDSEGTVNDADNTEE